MAHLIIRPTLIDDAPAILEIYRPYVENKFYTLDIELPELETIEKRILKYSDQHGFLTALLDDQIIGYGYAFPFSMRQAYEYTAELVLYMDRQYIEEENYSIALYQALEAKLQDKGIRVLLVVIIGHSSRLEAFYHSLGFKESGRFPQSTLRQGQWLDSIWLSKHL